MGEPRPYYPVLLDLAGRTVLVVGGGQVARRKVEGLAAAGARVRVVAPEICPAIRAVEGTDCREQAYGAAALDGAALAVAATDDPAVNSQVAADCGPRGVLCNVVDVPEQCDFILPSVLRRGPLVIAVSTGGASPGAAGRIRRQLEDRFGPAYGLWLERLAAVRAWLRDAAADEAVRRKAMLRLSEDDVLTAAQQGPRALDQRVSEILAEFGMKEDRA
jgi:precorrin-2 dehydrogenase/sirohydrochlorin ferrochelatase